MNKYLNKSIIDYGLYRREDNIRIIAMSPISTQKLITITRLAEIIKIKVGDELLYTLDDNGFFTVRKMDNILKSNEKYISANVVRKGNRNNLIAVLPREIIERLDIKVGENLVFIQYEDRVLIKSAFLPISCIINGIILYITALNQGITTVPEEVRELIFVEAGDEIVFDYKGCDIVVEPKGENNSKKFIAESKLTIRLQIYLKKEILNIIDPKDSQILWILDKDGDIIMRNSILPKNCF